MNDVPNIHIGGITGGQNNIGKTEIAGNQTQNLVQADSDLDAFQLIARLNEIMHQIDPGIANDIVPKLIEINDLPVDEMQTEANRSRLKALCEKLAPYGHLIWKSLATFGTGALESIAKCNPVINGIWQVCKMHANTDASED